MAKVFNFKVVTPERVFCEESVDLVVFDSPQGEMGVMAEHVPMLIANIPCELRMVKEGIEKKAAIGEGFIEITASGVRAIVDTAEWPNEIDIERARAAKARILEELEGKGHDMEMQLRLKASLDRANSRIKIADN